MESQEKSSAEAATGAPASAQADGSATGAAAPDARDTRIQELEAQLKEKESKYVYLYADFENFRKRVLKEQSDLRKFGWEPVATELLAVVDNLERALAHMPPTADKSMVEGIRMVLNQFRATLDKHGVQAIPTDKQGFDPNLHEAVSQEKADAPAGTILKEHSRGYTLHGRLLRPARVTVSA